MGRRAFPVLTLAGFAVALHAAWAQSATPPSPIPTPPIPAPPRLGPVPKLTLGNDARVARPSIAIPDAAELAPVAIPPPPEVTPAVNADSAPLSPPPAGPTPMESPGGDTSRIQEIAFILDPGTSRLSAPDEAKLRDVAAVLSRDKMARLEVRTFSPSKPHASSNAHRLSLARFLAIRDFLVQNGADEDRIDGRPLISDPSELNADRAELYIER